MRFLKKRWAGNLLSSWRASADKVYLVDDAGEIDEPGPVGRQVVSMLVGERVAEEGRVQTARPVGLKDGKVVDDDDDAFTFVCSPLAK